MYSEDIIPVTFVGGSGGRFLASFLAMANHGIMDKMSLSKHGNAHTAFHTPLPESGIDDNSMVYIESLFKFEINPFFRKPYFVSCHIADLNLLSKHFQKTIRIVYDEDDVSDIVLVFLGKLGIDDLNYSTQQLKDNYTKLTPRYKVIQRRFHFKSTPQLYDNVLFVSWKDLCYSEPDMLIEKLSNFTHVPQNQFSIDNLLNWRRATMDCLTNITSLINT